jgi:hypothetical protein
VDVDGIADGGFCHGMSPFLPALARRGGSGDIPDSWSADRKLAGESGKSSLSAPP